MITADSPDYVTALARGLSVLQVFDRDNSELTLTEVAALTKLSPATARRLLFTLEALGFVKMHGRRFLLTPHVLRLSAAFSASMHIQEVVQQYLQDIVDQTGDSSSFAVLDGSEVVYLASVQTKRPLQFSAGQGTRYPAYPTSLGRVLLAGLSDQKIDDYLNDVPLEALTKHTVTSPEKFRAILAQVRTDGYASVQDELDYGTVSVAVPVLDRKGVQVAAINCSTSPSRIRRAAMEKSRLPLLQRVAGAIGNALEQFPTLSHSIGFAGDHD